VVSRPAKINVEIGDEDDAREEEAVVKETANITGVTNEEVIVPMLDVFKYGASRPLIFVQSRTSLPSAPTSGTR